MGEKTEGMVKYETNRDGEYGELIQEKQPELYGKAQSEYEAALAAHKDKEKDLAIHHTKMANMLWRTAVAKVETAEAEHRVVRAHKRQADAEAATTEAAARVATAQDAVSRLERIANLEAKEASFKARDELANAMLAIKTAETMNAREYAASDLKKADAALEAATVALERGTLDESIKHGKAATAAAKRAADAARPQYNANRTQLAYEAKRRELFQEAGKLTGVSARITEGGVALTLHKLFGSGDVVIDSSRLGTIDGLAKLAVAFGEFSIVVEGHTDNRGGSTRNIALSQARADAVVAHLSTKGVNPSRMTSSGLGPAAPIANNRSKTGRAENRRIEIVFVQPAS